MFLFHIIVNSIYGKKRGTSLLMLEYIVVILTVCKNVGILLAKVHFLERNCQWRSKSDLHPEAYINCDAPNAIVGRSPHRGPEAVTGQGSGSQGSKALCRWKSFSCSMSNKSAKFTPFTASGKLSVCDVPTTLNRFQILPLRKKLRYTAHLDSRKITVVIFRAFNLIMMHYDDSEKHEMWGARSSVPRSKKWPAAGVSLSCSCRFFLFNSKLHSRWIALDQWFLPWWQSISTLFSKKLRFWR